MLMNNLHLQNSTYYQTHSAVFAKTIGLSDKTAKFRKCPANFVSLPDSMSDETL